MLFETHYFWAVFAGKDKEFLKKLRILLENAKSAFASSISIYEAYKLTLAHEGRAVADLRATTIRRDFTIMDVDPEMAEEDGCDSRGCGRLVRYSQR